MRVAVVPGVLALLPEYAARTDPVPELRAACLAAVAWLGPAPVVLGDPQGERVGRSLIDRVGLDTPSPSGSGGSTNESVEPGHESLVEPGHESLVEPGHESLVEPGQDSLVEPGHEVAGVETNTSGYLVVANGTARRTQSSPGPYDDRAQPFDDVLAKALLTPDPDALREVDQALAGELWASTTALPRLAELLMGTESVTVDYDDAPYGVQYWVVRYDR